MGNKKKEEGGENDVLQADAPKSGTIVDLSKRVKVEMNATAPYHKEGEVAEMSPLTAEKAVKNGWGALVAIALFMLFSFGAVAQNVFYNPLPATGSLAKSILSDTVTNTATAYLTSYAQTRTQAVSTVVQVVVTKISGTVGGTISLQGSLDGVNFKALNTEETQTALATITAADASTSYHWRLKGCPFTYYRVSWTGAGTMSASFSARLIVK